MKENRESQPTSSENGPEQKPWEWGKLFRYALREKPLALPGLGVIYLAHKAGLPVEKKLKIIKKID